MNFVKDVVDHHLDQYNKMTDMPYKADNGGNIPRCRVAGKEKLTHVGGLAEVMPHVETLLYILDVDDTNRKAKLPDTPLPKKVYWIGGEVKETADLLESIFKIK